MTNYPLDPSGLAVVPPSDLEALPPGFEAVEPPVRSGNFVYQTVRANGRVVRRTLNLLTGDNVLEYLD
jgi:hypothetical protein